MLCIFNFEITQTQKIQKYSSILSEKLFNQ